MTLQQIDNNFTNINRKINKAGYLYLTPYFHLKKDTSRRINYYNFIHILVFENEYNCCLLKWSAVHHRDGNKQNNVWYNLQGMTSRQHAVLHMKGNKYGLGNESPFKGKKRPEISGEKHPLYGKHPSEETRRKMSIAQNSEAVKLKHSLANKDRKHTPEIREKIRQIAITKWKNGAYANRKSLSQEDKLRRAKAASEGMKRYHLVKKLKRYQ